MPHDWLLELGHSRLKLARIASHRRLEDRAAMMLDRFPHWLQDSPPTAGDRFFLAAVTGADQRSLVRQVLAAGGWHCSEITTGSVALPVAAAYSGLGVDRWLALQPAWVELQRSLMVVDCGTATTIDLVDRAGRHRGGWILPGPETARAGLLARAPGLAHTRPELERADEPALDTADAVERGLWLQQAGAVRLARDAAVAAGRIEPDAALLLTGGAAGSLQSQLEGARLAPDLVLEGLAMAAECMNQR